MKIYIICIESAHYNAMCLDSRDDNIRSTHAWAPRLQSQPFPNAVATVSF